MHPAIGSEPRNATKAKPGRVPAGAAFSQNADRKTDVAALSEGGKVEKLVANGMTVSSISQFCRRSQDRE